MRNTLSFVLGFGLLCAGLGAPAHAQTQAKKPESKSSSSSSEKSEEEKSASKFETLTKDMKKVGEDGGLFTLYHNEQKLYAVLKSSDFGKNFIVLTSIARGVSSGMVLGGMSWGFGDDAIWTFKKVGEKVHVIRRNVRYKGSDYPEKHAVELAYSDSVLYALPILTDGGGGHLVDMTRIFMSDDAGIGRSLGGFSFASDRSTWAKVKTFPKNVELQVAAVYVGGRALETVADSRGVQVHVHYSISELPKNDYKPRVADDRIGYFLTVHKDFSKENDEQHFVRYINRWNLKKKDSKAKLSPPEKPIVFYIERTVPVVLRPTVEEAILEWNKAFEKLGFYKAIRVIQQEDDADWDPEDIRYNTFRWITAEAGFAMGPSRVNPLTGEILDADILFDASFLRYWSDRYETFSPDEARALLYGRPVSDPGESPLAAAFGWNHGGAQPHHCNFHHGMHQQMGFAAAVFAGRGAAGKKGELPEKFVHQGLKHVAMHEVGHTLGLRHNFKASSWKDLKDLSDGDDGQATVASVMDYSPANIAAKGQKQGLYYSQTIGPYDYWAIEYGYKPLSGDEKAELAKIAARGAEPGHDYATDEDLMTSTDPRVNTFDLGSNPVEFASRQMSIARELLPKVVDRSVEEGEGYQRARQAFGLLFSEYWRTAFFASRFPGGIAIHRDHKGDPDERPPFVITEPDQQRAAVKLLAEKVFSSPKYDSETLNYLAATRWMHWGMRLSSRIDFPIHDQVELFQSLILSNLINPATLSRLRDNELKVADGKDAFTLAEHMRRVVDALFAEWKREPQAGEHSNGKPYIDSFRRNLQRTALKQLAGLVTSGGRAPEDARALARMHLRELEQGLDRLLKSEDLKLDDYSRAHLLDAQQRIRQVLDAKLELRSIN